MTTPLKTLRLNAWRILLLGWLLSATGCALSPQTIAIRPDLKVPSMPIGHGRGVAVETQDQRRDTVLGTRGGIYKSATLTTDAHMEQSITQEAVTVLQSWDFMAVPATLGNSDMARFSIEVLDIDYRRPETAVGGNVTVKCRVGVRVDMGSDSYSGEYTSQRSEQVAVAGTTGGNQRMVNETISQALNQIFLDPKLQRFMAR